MANIPYVRQHADEHTAQLIAWYLGLSEETAGRMTDLNPGSNLRDVFEAIALKLEGLDNTVYTGLRAAIPAILYEWFGVGDGITTFVGFPLIPALPAQGIARFTRTTAPPPITVPLGTRLGMRVGEATITYATTQTVTLVSGDTVDAPIQASVAGPAGSVQANGLRLLDTISGIASATNPSALIGIPQESEEQRRRRFATYIRNLARCQCEGLEAGAMTAQVVQSGQVIEHVLEAASIEPPDKRGYVDLWIDNGSGAASPQLIENTQKIIDGYIDAAGARVVGYKAAGIVVKVRGVSPTPVPVTVAVQIDPLFTFATIQPVVVSAINKYIVGLGIADDLIWTELTGVIAVVPGVIDHRLDTPPANVSASIGGRIIPGPITVTQWMPT